MPSLTAKDIADPPFVAAYADVVGHSFVRSAADVDELEGRLAQVGGEQRGIVLKIETQQAFEQLPNLLLAAMRTPCNGVMIARGDLAIECSYERLAAVQEEILWICEVNAGRPSDVRPDLPASANARRVDGTRGSLR